MKSAKELLSDATKCRRRANDATDRLSSTVLTAFAEELETLAAERAEVPMSHSQKYRFEAQRLRLDAEGFHDPNVKNQMLVIAGQYDHLAAAIEAMEKDAQWRE